MLSLRLPALMAVLVLAGCNGIAGLSGPSSSQTLALFGGSVTAIGPPNYCVDARASQPRAGFAVLAPCQILGGDGPGVPALAVIVVQAGASGTAAVAGSEPMFAAFLNSDPGATLLSGSGDAATITRRDANAGQSVVTVIFDDRAPAIIPGVQETVWRGFVDIDGRLVTVSLRSLNAAPLSRAAGEALLLQTLSAMNAANALRGA